ncbi:MAG: bacteriohopanetetrol glucosamine biosynthesis glycosyltransferase HpnI [Gammaproteobacteria bacterium]
MSAIPLICLIPVVGGTLYAIVSVVIVLRYFEQANRNPKKRTDFSPAVTILKPVCGLEKELTANLRSACLQSYPDYEVIFSVQDPRDPALSILHEIRQEFGCRRVSVVVSDVQAGSNGKVNNLLGALSKASHDVVVISDSDTRLRSDYLSNIVAPLADPEVACACTLFKVTEADRLVEKLEALTINADFMPSVVFAEVTGASKCCLGPSIAIRRATLDQIGGLKSLADYLVEDYELGRRIWASGKKMALVPYVIDVVVDLPDWRRWWTHQVYWDQNTRLARPSAFLATCLIRSVPFALVFALLRLFDPIGLAALSTAVAVRIITAAMLLKWGFKEEARLRTLALLPFRDILGLITWALSFTQQTVIWRGAKFQLTRGGRMVPIES